MDLDFLNNLVIVNSVAIDSLTREMFDGNKNRIDEKKGHEPWNRGGLQKLKKIKKWVFPQSLQKEYRPANTLILDSVLQNYKIMNLCCLNPVVCDNLLQ